MIDRVRAYFKHCFLLIPCHGTRCTKERSSFKMQPVLSTRLMSPTAPGSFINASRLNLDESSIQGLRAKAS